MLSLLLLTLSLSLSIGYFDSNYYFLLFLCAAPPPTMRHLSFFLSTSFLSCFVFACEPKPENAFVVFFLALAHPAAYCINSPRRVQLRISWILTRARSVTLHRCCPLAAGNFFHFTHINIILFFNNSLIGKSCALNFILPSPPHRAHTRTHTRWRLVLARRLIAVCPSEFAVNFN